MSDVRPLADLRSSGLLWLINLALLHPQGFALGLEVQDDGSVTGWQLHGDSLEPWRYASDVDEEALGWAVEETLHRARLDAAGPHAFVASQPPTGPQTAPPGAPCLLLLAGHRICGMPDADPIHQVPS